MSVEYWKAQNAELRLRLEEAEETVRAIQSGAVDAFVVTEDTGRHRVYSLEGADRPYRVFVEQLPHGAATLERDGTIVYCNPRLSTLLELPQHRIIGASLQTFIDAADPLRGDDFVSDGLTHAGGIEAHLRLAGGARVPVLLAFNELTSDCSGAVGVLITDLTMQRHHEELARAHDALRDHERLLRTATEHAQIGLLIVDEQHRYLYANGAFADLLQLPLDSIVGLPLLDSMGPTYEQHVRPRLEQAFKGKRVQDEFPFLPLPGTLAERSVAVSFEPQEQDGRIRSVVVAVLDVTQRKQAEKEREQLLNSERAARSEAERAARLKEEFLATLSHELRTPLNAIVGWAHLLKTEISDPEKARHGVEIIERNARLQAQLIADLLDMSRIISGKMYLDLQRVELAPVIDAAIDVVRPAAEAKGVRILSTIESGSTQIEGDPARLQQVVWNLMSNAVKFTPRGGCVQIVLARADPYALITVNDTGEGIRPDFLPHVFERFRQSDASPTRHHGGLGLGLALVKQLVEIHRGRVTAASEGEGCGATFAVELPLSPAHALERDRRLGRATRSGEVVETQPELEGVVVLVVDDEPDAIEMVRRLLVECDAEVVTATSSAEALGYLDRRTFDVIVSDIGMPEMNGYELVSEIRKRGVGVPAAALTAFAGADDRKRALSSGFQAFMTKPIQPVELLTTVASLTGRPSRRFFEKRARLDL